MFLWELKNGIISTNLRELCVIKANIKSTHSGFDKLSHQFFYYTLPEPVEGTFSLLISVPEPVEGTIISIVLKYVCFLEHLWCSFENSKTQSFQQNLRELCVIKINTNIPHTVASTSSATVLFITTHAALACWRHVLNSHLGAWACRRPFLFLPVISWTSFADFQSVLNHHIIYYYTRCLSVVEGTFSILISVPEPVEGTFSILISVPEPVEGTLFLLH